MTNVPTILNICIRNAGTFSYKIVSSGSLKISIDTDINDFEYFVNRFLKEIFIAINISNWFDVNMREIELSRRKTFFDDTVIYSNLDVGAFDISWSLSRKWGYRPKLVELPCEVVINYLEKISFREINRCRNGIDRILRYLVSIAKNDIYDEYSAIELISIFEMFIGNNAYKKRNALMKWLNGIYNNDRIIGWLDEIYTFRNAIIHGRYLPYWEYSFDQSKEDDKEYDRFLDLIDYGNLILVSLLQRAIEKGIDQIESLGNVQI